MDLIKALNEKQLKEVPQILAVSYTHLRIAHYHISQRFAKTEYHPQYNKRLLWERLHPVIFRCVLFRCTDR